MKMTVKERQARIHRRIRGRVSGSTARPRLAVFRSNKGIFCQIIDDSVGHTLASASSKETTTPVNGNKQQNKQIFKPAGFIYDNEYNVGVCGDWLYESSISGAWISGQLLADYMINKQIQQNQYNQQIQNNNNNNSLTNNTIKIKKYQHGINGKFQTSEIVTKTGIGSIQ